ncbi:hypothetical protein D3C83_84960 [compost metagenome]
MRSATPKLDSREPCLMTSIDFTMAELSAARTDVDSRTVCTRPMMFSMARLMERLPVSCSPMARFRCFV